MKRRQRKPEKGSPKWMVTFSDMILLILVFFVMLFSMSVIDAKKFEAISDSFQSQDILEYFPSMEEADNPEEQKEAESDAEAFAEEEDATGEEANELELERLLEEVDEYLEENELNEYISATRDDRGVVLVLQEQLLFDTAEAEILQEAEPFLTKVETLLHTLPNLVKVEGHTDNRPISSYRYPSNWELSGARASSVIRFLTENNDLEANRFIATGYGKTRPIVPNDSAENLRTNRRVVIVISDPAFEDELLESAGGV